MNINWKVRLKNPTFWATIIPSAIGIVYLILKLLGIEPLADAEEVESGLMTVITGLAMLGILNDPTTKGISDSEQAMSYEEPKGDE